MRHLTSTEKNHVNGGYVWIFLGGFYGFCQYARATHAKEQSITLSGSVTAIVLGACTGGAAVKGFKAVSAISSETAAALYVTPTTWIVEENNTNIALLLND